MHQSIFTCCMLYIEKSSSIGNCFDSVLFQFCINECAFWPSVSLFHYQFKVTFLLYKT